VRVLAVALALVSVALPAKAERHAARCPGDASLGAVTFARGRVGYRVSLADCREQRAAQPPAPSRPRGVLRSRGGRVARIAGKATILVDGRVVHQGRAAAGPLGLVDWSPDGRWLFFYLDPLGSNSIAADGLELQALRVADGKVVVVAAMLLSRDYLSWCGSSLVLTAGGDRIATHHKRLVVARAPDWRPHVLWSDPRRAFGSVACAPDGSGVAVLSQRDNMDAHFFHTRWQLWRVGLDRSRRLLDEPPRGSADESPRWSRDGNALLFVRERQGIGRLLLWRRDQVTGPFANLGYQLGYYGHHDWWAGATWTAGA
jgi:hypothetical protein